MLRNAEVLFVAKILGFRMLTHSGYLVATLTSIKLYIFSQNIYMYVFHMIFRKILYYFNKRHKNNGILMDKKYVFCERGTGLLSVIWLRVRWLYILTTVF